MKPVNLLYMKDSAKNHRNIMHTRGIRKSMNTRDGHATIKMHNPPYIYKKIACPSPACLLYFFINIGLTSTSIDTFLTPTTTESQRGSVLPSSTLAPKSKSTSITTHGSLSSTATSENISQFCTTKQYPNHYSHNKTFHHIRQLSISE